MRKLLIVLFGFILVGIGITGAQEQASFEIIPSAGNDAAAVVSNISSQGGKVWENYRKKSQENLSLGTRFASGVMTWDTILEYIVYLMKFLGQLTLLVGAVAIIYFGYKKAIGGKGGTSQEFLHIVVGILVVIFAYVIIKTIWSAFVS